MGHPNTLGWETAEDGEYGSEIKTGQAFVLGDANPARMQCRNGLQCVFCRASTGPASSLLLLFSAATDVGGLRLCSSGWCDEG